MNRSRLFWFAAPCLLASILVYPARAEEVEDRARTLFEHGKVEEAMQLIEEQVDPANRNAETWFLLSKTYHMAMDRSGFLKKRGWAKKMKQALQFALEVDPEHVGARKELADFYHYAPGIVGGDDDEAARQLNILERYAPAEAWATRGEFAQNEGDLEAAADHFERAVALDPDAPEYLFALAVVEQQRERYEASIPLLEVVIEGDASHEEAYYYRAKASAESGLDIDRGLECAAYYLDHCERCDEADRGFGWWRRASILEHAGQTEAAITAYREALSYNPELDDVRQRLKELDRQRRQP